MARRKKLELPKPELNITSMMDLVLNLLTFFVLVSNFSAAELPQDIKPPKPLESRALSAASTDKITLNIVPINATDQSGVAKEIKFGAYDPIPLPTDYVKLREQIAAELHKSKENKSDLHVDLRAHRDLNYDQISPIMNVLKTSGISQINVVAEVKD
jgi:biopolymer transport protein ExbD